MKFGILAATAAVGVMAASSALAAPLLTNGGFEDIGAASPQGWGGYTYGAGYTPVLPGWSIDSGTVDITQTGTVWGPAFEGTNSLDINGWNPGQISQSFATTPGKHYEVSLEYSRNAAGAPDPATADVSAGGKVLHLSAANDGSFGGPNAMVWKSASFDFVASGPTSTLTLAATSPGNGGVFFDDLKVSGIAVPEPAAWTMMLIGLGALGAAARARRSAPATAA